MSLWLKAQKEKHCFSQKNTFNQMCLNSDSKLQDNRKMKSPPFIDPLFVQTGFLICDLLFKIF